MYHPPAQEDRGSGKARKDSVWVCSSRTSWYFEQSGWAMLNMLGDFGFLCAGFTFLENTAFEGRCIRTALLAKTRKEHVNPATQQLDGTPVV